MVQKAESRLQRRMRKRLEEEFGGWWVKIHGSIYQAGIPDLVGCVCGMFIAIEVKKSENEDASELQWKTIDNIKAEGGLSFCTHDIEEAVRRVRRHLEKAGRLPKRSSTVRPRDKDSGTAVRAGNRKDVHNARNNRGSAIRKL